MDCSLPAYSSVHGIFQAIALMAESEEELKSLLMKVKVESEKVLMAEALVIVVIPSANLTLITKATSLLVSADSFF